MAQFYAEIQGNHGEVSRTGSKQSGISGHIRGWNVGAKVYCVHNESKDCDEVFIYATSGSSRIKSDEQIAKIIESNDNIKIEINPELIPNHPCPICKKEMIESKDTPTFQCKSCEIIWSFRKCSVFT